MNFCSLSPAMYRIPLVQVSAANELFPILFYAVLGLMLARGWLSGLTIRVASVQLVFRQAVLDCETVAII